MNIHTHIKRQSEKDTHAKSCALPCQYKRTVFVLQVCVHAPLHVYLCARKSSFSSVMPTASQSHLSISRKEVETPSVRN